MTDSAEIAVSRRRLILEFGTFFLAAPFVMAVFLPPNWMFPMLFALTAIGLILLATTPGFRWRSLPDGVNRMSGTLIFGVTIGTAVIGTAIMLTQRPESFLLIRHNPQLALLIAVFYPILSALPQELVFRPLFFERYAGILPQSAWAVIPLNAAIFSFVHLMYWSWVVAILTFLGGLVFAYSYVVRRNFAEAVVAHSLAGVVLFALGMGVYFFSGNVTRPF